jgi:hypothetical protein
MSRSGATCNRRASELLSSPCGIRSVTEVSQQQDESANHS